MNLADRINQSDIHKHSQRQMLGLYLLAVVKWLNPHSFFPLTPHLVSDWCALDKQRIIWFFFFNDGKGDPEMVCHDKVVIFLFIKFIPHALIRQSNKRTNKSYCWISGVKLLYFFLLYETSVFWLTRWFTTILDFNASHNPHFYL